MHLPPFNYTAPKTVAEGMAAQKIFGRFLAGGTDLFVSMKDKTIAPDMVVDLSQIACLKGVQRDVRTKEFRIGALTTLSQVQADRLILKHLPVLSQKISLVSTWQLRNMGTLGGNLCLDTRCTYYNQPNFLKRRWEPCLKMGGKICHVVKRKNTCYAVYSGDMAIPLIALDASLRVAGKKGARQKPLSQFFTGSGIKPNILKFNEILTEIRIPPLPPNSALSYQKLRLRDTVDFPLLGVAVFLQVDPKDKICLDVRLVLGAIGPAPLAVAEAHELMLGRRISTKRIDAVSRAAQKLALPVDNTASSPVYRRQMIPLLVKRAFAEAMAQIEHGVSS